MQLIYATTLAPQWLLSAMLLFQQDRSTTVSLIPMELGGVTAETGMVVRVKALWISVTIEMHDVSIPVLELMFGQKGNFVYFPVPVL